KAGTFEEKVTVKVVEAGEVVDYKVEGFVEELFYEKDDDKDLKDEMTLAVKGIDEKGLVVPTEVANVQYVVKDKDGKDVTSNVTEDNKILVSKIREAEKEGPFTLTVKVGTLTVFTGEFTVTDNREVPD